MKIDTSTNSITFDSLEELEMFTMVSTVSAMCVCPPPDDCLSVYTAQRIMKEFAASANCSLNKLDTMVQDWMEIMGKTLADSKHNTEGRFDHDGIIITQAEHTAEKTHEFTQMLTQVLTQVHHASAPVVDPSKVM